MQSLSTKHMKKLPFLLVLFGLLGFAIHSSAQSCYPEDCLGNESTSTAIPETGIIIGAPTVPMINIDFNSFPAGPVSVAALNAAFPGANIENIVLLPSAAGDGFYNTTVVGKALGKNGGTLSIIEPSTTFQTISSMLITFENPISEVGIRFGDWIGPGPSIDFRQSNGNNLVPGALESSAALTGSTSFNYYQNNVLFDQIQIANQPNWVISGLQIQESHTIPTMSEWGLILFGLLLFNMAIIGMFYKKKSARLA